jgi:two-component system chemotaxis response regulator CheB
VGKTRVIVVDDSQVMRDIISQIVNAEPDMEVAGTAQDAFEAREKIKALSPDVVLLDIEMPRMDGLTFLERIMRLRPMPVVMVSTLTVAGGKATLRALELGAVDFVSKPASRFGAEVGDDFAADIAAKVRIAAAAPPLGVAATNAVVAVGASTGGIEAITTVLSGLPPNAPPLMIVQHLPQPFTRLFAARLNTQCALKVKEAEHGDILHPGHVYIAPGNKHMRLGQGVSGYTALLSDDPQLHGHRPAVDYLFHSVAGLARDGAVGVILSGMGADGAAGLLRMRQAGAITLGQDAATCVVYGMPRAAQEIGAVVKQVSLEKIAGEILTSLRALDRATAPKAR